MNEVIILADGDFPQRQQLREMLVEAKTVICCDGAADKLLAFGREPDWIVGDLDSVAPETKSRFAGKTVKFHEQETNDLAKAFRFCAENSIFPTAVLGASGAREDHLLGNLSRFAENAVKFPGCRLYTDTGFFTAFAGQGRFAGEIGGQVSVFSFDPAQKLTSQGLKYPLENLALPWWYSGTLNEISCENFSLQATTKTPVLLFFKYQA